eukprot:g27555.t1
MGYFLESVSFLDTRSHQGRTPQYSLYLKLMDNLTMLHFSSFHPKHIKTATAYRQALRICRICLDEEECDGHLKVLKYALIGTGYDAQLIDCQFRHVTARNRNDLLRSQIRDTSDRVAIIVQYFPGAEKLHHVLCSLQNIIDDNEHLTKILPTPPLLTFKQPPNLKQTIVRSKLPAFRTTSNTTLYNPVNLCKTCQIIDMDTTITHGNTTHQVYGRYSCDLANNVYLLHRRQGCSEAWYIGKTMQAPLKQRMNGHHATIARQACSFPAGEFSGQGHSVSDLWVNVLQGGLRDTQQCRVSKQRLIAKFGINEDGVNRDLGFMLHN